MTFADRFKLLLAREGLTRAEVAHRLGTSPQAVQFWAAGRNEPRDEFLPKLAEIFGVSQQWLKWGEGDPGNGMTIPDADGTQDSNGIGKRLTRLLSDRGMNQFELAQALGVSKQAVQTWLSGRSVPQGSNLLNIAEYFEVTTDWILYGNNEESSGPVAVGAKHKSNRSPSITVYKYDLRFSAGPGACAPEWVEAPDSVRYFSEEELAALGVNPDRCIVADVSGDSMYPTIFDGDEVLFEAFPDSRLGVVPILDGKIYAISIDNDMKVKRLSKIKNGIIVRSDNESYPDEVYTGEECDRIRVYGQVVKSSHVLR